MKKVAKLVTVSFITRVIVNEDATDDQIMVEAKPNFYDKLNNNELFDNLESIIDDEQCPYSEEDELFEDNSIDKLIIKVLKKSFILSEKIIKDVSRVYETSTDTDILYYWNSSNNGAIAHGEVLGLIADELEGGSLSGSVTDPISMAEIMFEVIEK